MGSVSAVFRLTEARGTGSGLQVCWCNAHFLRVGDWFCLRDSLLKLGSQILTFLVYYGLRLTCLQSTHHDTFDVFWCFAAGS